ncbi:MAG: hypothetical protein PHF46_01710 [Candidatus Gracilibacteria bacterium]|nr:hypothetical protein [Candidatus Gracilibacteria bacterium]MDD4530322.1 hypothetical protein [Candidatus Gracilibacteria bacterium]
MGNPTSINRDYSIASVIENIDISERKHLGRFFNLDLMRIKNSGIIKRRYGVNTFDKSFQKFYSQKHRG